VGELGAVRRSVTTLDSWVVEYNREDELVQGTLYSCLELSQ
jgi:hypothetical protein